VLTTKKIGYIIDTYVRDNVVTKDKEKTNETAIDT
jgi:hypothetical protein